MKARYLLAPQAVRDLGEIWLYLEAEAGVQTANKVEVTLRARFALLAQFPLPGHLQMTSRPLQSASYPHTPTLSFTGRTRNRSRL